MYKLTLPAGQDVLKKLRAGDTVAVSGVIYTGRDAAHKRMYKMIQEGNGLPFDLYAIYYTGPCPAPPGGVIGSCGPTTSSRMDAYTPRLLDMGLKIMIGKGGRSPEVVEAMKRNGAVYLAATGGAGALLAESVRSCSVEAFPELGTEAVYRLEVVDFPAVVAIDSQGNNLYKIGPEKYKY
ncbi:MAG TPA: Fe-S-containing hydro-lyase [Clostridia bacterium]|nr:Fe-S-containing hydro-lyase [Clostridia bacterium]